MATSGWAIAQGILNMVMAANPIILIISLLIALGIWIYSICKQYDGWGDSMTAIWEIIKAFGKLAILPYKEFGEGAWYFVNILWLKIKDFADNMVGVFSNVGNAIQAALHGDFSGAKTALTATIQTNASKDIVALEAAHAANKNDFAAQYAAGVSAIQTNYAKIGLHKWVTTGTGKGVDPTTANQPDYKKGFGGLSSFGGSDGKKAKDKADSINSGGQRSIIINIGKQIETLHQHIVGGSREVADELAGAVREALRRELYSLNGVAS